ncbi:Outer envelope pore protein 24, chloroplastic [Heracleum sosnowskyi]|uniref:Outer envelope pore protein 24, chloroplastic n=1 Tax=Heracleum sosnowskyi TaxID=360622 RepID=A0AAD8IRX9_9APIA|nr:Outer envelope pore protein 24, chloroplastic [Heracleum sosnowskyi]
MIKGSLKVKNTNDKNSAGATFAVNAGNVKLRASMTEAIIVNGPSFNGLALSLEKPGSFIIDYNVPKKDIRFQFMNSIKVAEKPINLNYIHFRNDNRTILDGTIVFDSANKVSVNHVVGSGNAKLKYTYLHAGVTTFEQSYDVAKETWDFAVSRKVYGDDVVKASYQSSKKLLGLDWTRTTKQNGSFKISASFVVGEQLKTPNICAESSWDFEM